MDNGKMTLALISMMNPGINYSKGIWASDRNGLNNFTDLFKTQDAYNIVPNTLCYNSTSTTG